MDTFSKRKRSEIMAAVRSSGNRSTETKLRAMLAGAGVRSWKMKSDQLPGSPDFVFPGKRIALFVDGCFWHGCPQCYRRPKSSRKYWDAKVLRNMARDKRVSRELKKLGWQHVRIWEHEVVKERAACLKKLKQAYLIGTTASISRDVSAGKPSP